MILCLALVKIVITNLLNLEIENFSSGVIKSTND